MSYVWCHTCQRMNTTIDVLVDGGADLHCPTCWRVCGRSRAVDRDGNVVRPEEKKP